MTHDPSPPRSHDPRDGRPSRSRDRRSTTRHGRQRLAPLRALVEPLAIDLSVALNLRGALVKWFSPAFLFPTAIAIGYREPLWWFLLPGAAAGLFGLALERATSGKERVTAREVYLVVALVWLLVPVVGCLPISSRMKTS